MSQYKPQSFKKRQPYIPTSTLNWILKKIVRRITGGSGINVVYFGDRIVISSKQRGRNSGSGSASTTTAASTNWSYTRGDG